MQAVAWDFPTALKRLGMAIAASKAMMAITIMISTSVNPRDLFARMVFIGFLRGVNSRQAGLLIMTFSFTNCLPEPLVF